jgi:DNA relaxase NicK
MEVAKIVSQVPVIVDQFYKRKLGKMVPHVLGFSVLAVLNRMVCYGLIKKITINKSAKHKYVFMLAHLPYVKHKYVLDFSVSFESLGVLRFNKKMLL